MIPRHFYIAVSVLFAAVLGMSLYAWHMRGRAAATPGASTDTRPVVASRCRSHREPVTLFVAYDDVGVLRLPSPLRFRCPRSGRSAPKNCCGR